MLGAFQAPGGLCRPVHCAPRLCRAWRSPSPRSQPKHLPKLNVAAHAARGISLDLAQNPKAPAPWQLVVFLTAGAMLTCNLHRSVFTMLLPDLTSAHLLTLRDVGVMNSAMLGGYLAGQIPAGFLSDMLGGERVLLVGLLLWSLSLASTGLMPNQLGLIVSRVAMGLFSACAMPATSAMAAKWVPPQIKASTLATIYMLFNMGGVLGLVATPFIGQVCGLTSTFMAFGLAGALWAVAGWLCLPSDKRTGAQGQVLKGADESGDVAVEGEGFGGVYHHVEGPGSDGHSNGSSSSSSSSGSGGGSGSSSRVSSGVRSSSSSERGSDGNGSSSALRFGGSSTSSSSSSGGGGGEIGGGYGVSINGGGWNGNGVSLNGSGSMSGGVNGNGNGNVSSATGVSYGFGLVRGADYEGIHLRATSSSSSSSSLHSEAAASSGRGSSSQLVGAGSRSALAVAEREEEVVQEQHPPPPAPRQQLEMKQVDQHPQLHQRQPMQQPQQQQQHQQPQQEQQQKQQQEAGQNAAVQGQQHPPLLAQISVLCWAHGVMGFGFFIFQSWIPMYLASLGLSSPTSTGLLAGMPWLAAGLVGAVAGNLADTCIRKGIPRLTVRRGAHTISTLGCALCAVPLALGWATTPTAATGWLVLFQSCYAFSFGGFHAYVQDVAQASAGKLLGLTNSCSIALGIVGNLCTGVLVESTGSYSAVFLVTIGLYLTSLAAFFAFLRGTPLEFA